MGIRMICRSKTRRAISTGTYIESEAAAFRSSPVFFRAQTDCPHCGAPHGMVC